VFFQERVEITEIKVFQRAEADPDFVVAGIRSIELAVAPE
jgi:hypothetical protein